VVKNKFIPLVAAYAGLIAYGSLFPFTGWQAESTPTFAFLTHWPPSYSRADIFSNVLAYAPLGLFVALATRSRTLTSRVALAGLAGAALSVSMEMLQHWIPSRVVSVFDVIANICGSAAGALVAESVTMPPVRQWRATWFKAGRLADVGLMVVVAWALSQWSPFVPSLEISHLRQGVAPIWWTLRSPTTFNVMQAAVYAFSIAGLALLARTLVMPGKPAFRLFFSFVALVLGYKILVVGRQLSLEALIGASAAFVIALPLVAQRARVSVRFGTLFVLAGFVCAELAPGSDVARYPFNWVPFGAHLQNPLAGMSTILEVLWPAGALAYLARTQGASSGLKGGAGLVMLAFALEWSQQWIPGRHGDVTTVVVMALAWAACFLACPGKRPYESVGAPAGVRKFLGLCLIAGSAVSMALSEQALGCANALMRQRETGHAIVDRSERCLLTAVIDLTVHLVDLKGIGAGMVVIPMNHEIVAAVNKLVVDPRL
jgi:VanZ family protein